MSQTLKNLLVALIFVAVLVAGYFMITQRSASTLSFDGENTENLFLKTQVFIARRAALEGLMLDTTLFTNERFTSLRSYTTAIPEQTIGRPNIFDAATPVPSVPVNAIE